MEKRCVVCGNPLIHNGAAHPFKYCSKRCRDRAKARRAIDKYRDKNPVGLGRNNTTGAISELRVAVDLLAKGYNVFRALSPSCPCDLVILNNNDILRVEVTTGKYSPSGIIQYPSHNPELYDILAVVSHDRIHYFPDLKP